MPVLRHLDLAVLLDRGRQEHPKDRRRIQLPHLSPGDRPFDFTLPQWAWSAKALASCDWP